MKKTTKDLASLIISKTLIFIFVLVFINVFQSFFGSLNTLVAVSTIILMLAFLERDFTVEPFKNLIQLLSINLLIGIGTFIVYNHLWIGILVNFSIIFLICYLFSNQVNKPYHSLIALQYLFLLMAPVTLSELPLRLLALIVGAFIIMAVQLLANRNKLSKLNKKLIKSIEDMLLSKIDLYRKNTTTDDINKDIEFALNKFKLNIAESGRKDFHITSCGKATIDIVSCLEKINMSLDAIDIKSINLETMDSLYNLLESIKENKFISNDINTLLEKNSPTTEVDHKLYELLITLEMLNSSKSKLKSIPSKSNNIIHKETIIPEDFKRFNIFKRNLHLDDIRVAYGLRMAILFTTTSFFVNYFDLQFGNWALVSVFVITQFYEEFSIIKAKKRLAGTLIGAAILFILFSAIQDVTMRTTLSLAFGYIMQYFTNYTYVSIFITMSAVSPYILESSSPTYVILSRVFFTIIGAAIALLANKYIFPRRYADEENSLKDIEKQMTYRIIDEVKNMKDRHEDVIDNLYLLPAQIENRITLQKLSISKEELKANKILINNLHQLHLMYDENEVLFNDITHIVNNISSVDNIETYVNQTIDSINDTKEKALLSLSLNTILHLNNLKLS